MLSDKESADRLTYQEVVAVCDSISDQMVAQENGDVDADHLLFAPMSELKSEFNDWNGYRKRRLAELNA